jgi:glycosyltransferase involved in cell wall biosynthesis
MDKYVLHIANDYAGSMVYQNLCSALDQLGVRQIVYTPTRNANQNGRNPVNFQVKDSEIMYSKVLDFSTRIDFCRKISRITKDIESKVNCANCEIIHAHTWYSDGAVAYELFKSHGIPYIITIRNTDLNLFYKYMIHLRRYAMIVLMNAKRIVFVNMVYSNRFLNIIQGSKNFASLSSKCLVIPNGIDSFWLQNVYPKKAEISGGLRLIFIGKITSGKNVMKLMRAVSLINELGVPCHLDIVGPAGSEIQSMRDYSRERSSFTYHGEIHDKNELMQLMRRSHVFTMPSRAETFGLVYIEALTQGLPVIYSTGEGIDGLYCNIGEGVNSSNIKSIANGILYIYKHYSSYSYNVKNLLEQHDWMKIGSKYISLYLMCSTHSHKAD